MSDEAVGAFAREQGPSCLLVQNPTFSDHEFISGKCVSLISKRMPRLISTPGKGVARDDKRSFRQDSRKKS